MCRRKEEIDINIQNYILEIKRSKKIIQAMKRLLNKGMPVVGFDNQQDSLNEIATTIYTKNNS